MVTKMSDKVVVNTPTLNSEKSFVPRERKFIRKCPDGCGKDEYDLGVYRGFQLFQKPFYGGWQVYGDMTFEPDALDFLLMLKQMSPRRIQADTEMMTHPTLEQVEQGVIEGIDDYWKEKQSIIDDVKADKFKVVADE
jgi:hypothetical protein